jgi:peptide/nickel transport system permease protein
MKLSAKASTATADRSVPGTPLWTDAPSCEDGNQSAGIARWTARKLVRLGFVLTAVSMLTFCMLNMLPGDVAYVIGGVEAAHEDLESIRQAIGLDRHLVHRYLGWAGKALQGDLGTSYLSGEPVLSAILERLPVTLELILFSQFLALCLAVPAGILGAVCSGTVPDRLVTSIGFATLSVPSFVMALLAIFFFSIRLQWMPATGYTPLSAGLWMNIRSFILPALSIALIEWVVLMRVLRSDMISTLQQDFILMARAKGLPPWKIILRHALKPSSFSMITILGLQIGRHIGEAVIVESIFALPGIGRLMINAIYNRDYLLVQGCILFITTGYVTINTIIDVAYGILDPRIRWGGT